jgi:heme/copper-type cytochrome/quinol oxidase subunit 3
MEVVFVLVISGILAMVSHKMAENRNRSGAAWAVGGFFLGFFAIAAIYLLGDAKK